MSATPIRIVILSSNPQQTTRNWSNERGQEVVDTEDAFSKALQSLLDQKLLPPATI
jgi:hypothetical protein